MSFTVVPLHDLRLPRGTKVQFGNGFVFQDMPDWLKRDTILETLSKSDREAVLGANHALIAEYPASAIGEADPSWTHKGLNSIQDLKYQSAMIANLALWLIQPSPLSFTVVFHALTWPHLNTQDRIPAVQYVHTQVPLFCHPKDVDNPVKPHHIAKAGVLHIALSSVPPGNPVWEAMRSFWAALCIWAADRRHPFFWIGLESLFGAKENQGEISYRLAQRIAFFLSNTTEDARTIFRMTKNCYNMRSKIIHGRWTDDPAITELIGDTEAIVRTVVRHILDDPKMIEVFISNQRDDFLDEWVFSRNLNAPPLPVFSTHPPKSKPDPRTKTKKQDQ